METVKSHNAKRTGEIEITTYPEYESLAKETQKLFRKKICSQCLSDWWLRKDEAVETDLCPDCRKENLRKLVEQNKDNL